MSVPAFARWQQALHCTGHAEPGAMALMAGLLLRYRGAGNLGIYNCRPTALGNLSAHAEGRATDVKCGLALGNKIVADLLKIGPSELGISAIIHDRRIYSRQSPMGRPYSGEAHTDHVHIEITRKAARDLSLARVKRVLGLARPPAPTPAKAFRTLGPGSTGANVKTLQRLLGMAHRDGIFGAHTEAAVRAYQRAHGLPQSGVISAATWAALNAPKP